jgi:hypothetical protein
MRCSSPTTASTIRETEVARIPLKASARSAAQEFRPGKGLGPDRRILRQGRKFLVGCFGRRASLFLNTDLFRASTVP